MLHYANPAQFKCAYGTRLIIAHSGRGFPHTFVRLHVILSLVLCRGFATHTPLRNTFKNFSTFFQGGDVQRTEGVKQKKTNHKHRALHQFANSNIFTCG